MRGRGYSYSPSPPRSYRGRGRSPSPRGCYGGRGRSPSPRGYGGRGRDLSTSLLVRNLRHDCRPEDLRKHFFQFGPLKDIYLPRDFRTGEPRGFGFIQYVDAADAAEAKYQMDGRILLGRELTVVYAEENRKKPAEMRARERVSRGRTYGNRRSPRFSRSPRYSRSRSPPRRHSSRHSRSPHYARSRSRSPSYHSPSPKRLQHSQSASPQDRRNCRERSYSLSPSPDAPGSSRSPIEDDDYDARKDSRRERSRSLSQ